MRRPSRAIRCINPRLFDSMMLWPMLGIDEVGTGCAAGPITAAGVILPQDTAVLDALDSAGLRDSKLMVPGSRTRVRDLLLQHAEFISVRFIYPRELERLGQSAALDKMFNSIMAEFRRSYDAGSIVLDGSRRTRIEYEHTALHQGDQKSFSVAAASVVAKVARDEVMLELAPDFPGYDLLNNKGYLTKAHLDGLATHGVSEIHRRGVKPVRDLVERGFFRVGQSPEELGETKAGR